jgi:hypothetical protein
MVIVAASAGGVSSGGIKRRWPGVMHQSAGWQRWHGGIMARSSSL